jgi:hypothetical protein
MLFPGKVSRLLQQSQRQGAIVTMQLSQGEQCMRFGFVSPDCRDSCSASSAAARASGRPDMPCQVASQLST